MKCPLRNLFNETYATLTRALQLLFDLPLFINILTSVIALCKQISVHIITMLPHRLPACPTHALSHCFSLKTKTIKTSLEFPKTIYPAQSACCRITIYGNFHSNIISICTCNDRSLLQHNTSCTAPTFPLWYHQGKRALLCNFLGMCAHMMHFSRALH